MPIDVMPARMTGEELADLANAVKLLESRGLASRLTQLFGRQVDALGRALPAPARKVAIRAAEGALRVALRVAVRSLKSKPLGKATPRMHKVVAAAAGAVGGALGMSALAIELPISTTILLRSIADIARAEGEDLATPAASLACIEVFALGGQGQEDAAIEGGYLAVRAALAQSVSESARFIAQQGLASETAPALVRLISQIGSRFGISVSQKLAAQAVPVIGAMGGAAVNAAFADHFQSLAKGHFIVRRLERAHGAEAVSFEYRRLRNEGLGRA